MLVQRVHCNVLFKSWPLLRTRSNFVAGEFECMSPLLASLVVRKR